MQPTVPKLILKMRPGLISRLFALFQRGFRLPVPQGSTVGVVLNAAGFSRGYLEKVKTIFLDGNAVDNFESEKVKNGSVIALSAAMPGLAGAIFRKDSPISELRSHPTKQQNDRSILDADEAVILKMFNTIAEEMGSRLLQGGVLFSGEDLGNFFATRRELLEKAIAQAEYDGAPVGMDALFNIRFTDFEQILLAAYEM